MFRSEFQQGWRFLSVGGRKFARGRIGGRKLKVFGNELIKNILELQMKSKKQISLRGQLPFLTL